MQPTEELYNLIADPLELVNQAQNPGAGPKLAEMRERYDAELKKWDNLAVPYNNYRQYVRLFDRSVPWQEKSFGKADKP